MLADGIMATYFDTINIVFVMEKSNNIHIIVQVLHTHCVCSIDKSTDYSRNSTLTTATGYCNCTAVVS